MTIDAEKQYSLILEADKERRRVARAYGEALLMLVPLMLLYWMIPPGSGLRPSYDFINAVPPIYFCSVLGLLAIRTLRRMPESVWTGLFWFPVVGAVFYGFGPLVEVYGNDITLQSLASHSLAVTDVDLYRANKLSTTSILCILSAFFFHLKFRPQAWVKRSDAKVSKIPIVKLGILMVLIGAGFKYLILLPASWGSIDIIIAGALSGLGNVVDIGFAVVAFAAVSGSRRQRRFFLIFWPIHLFLSVLTLSKLTIVTSILLPIVGAYIAHRNRKKLIFGLVLIAFVYGISQSFVHYGRGVVFERTSTISDAGYAERVGILVDYIFKGNTVKKSFDDDKQGWWTRLSFAGPQAYAMRLYDRGDYNRTLGNAWVYFIPRLVWPDKPILLGPGLEFYRKVTGHTEVNSFLALSIYGDLYWQYGWGGVVFGSLVIGFLFATLSSQAVSVIRRRQFLLLPAVLMALELTIYGPNKYILNGIIGPLPIYFAYYVLMGWLSKNLESKIR